MPLNLGLKYIITDVRIIKDFPSKLEYKEEYDRMQRYSLFIVNVHVIPPFESASEKADYYYEDDYFIEVKVQEAIEKYIKKYFQGPQPVIIIKKMTPTFLKMEDKNLSFMKFKVEVLEMEKYV